VAKKILLVDDAIVVRIMLKEILTPLGYEVVAEAKNGKEAAEMYAEFKPDIVTMDIIMPIVDGLEGLEAIMKLNPKAKVVMLTAVGQERAIQKAAELGAKGFIMKPYNDKEVVEAIEKALAAV